MKKITVVLLSTMLLITLVGCSQPKEKSEKGKIAFVTGTGGLGDGAFNDLGYEGVKKLMDEGVQVDVAEPSSVSDIEGIIANFANAGDYDLIVSMGGDSVDFVNSVSLDYPDQPILVMDGLAGEDNGNVRAVFIESI